MLVLTYVNGKRPSHLEILEKPRVEEVLTGAPPPQDISGFSSPAIIVTSLVYFLRLVNDLFLQPSTLLASPWTKWRVVPEPRGWTGMIVCTYGLIVNVITNRQISDRYL